MLNLLICSHSGCCVLLWTCDLVLNMVSDCRVDTMMVLCLVGCELMGGGCEHPNPTSSLVTCLTCDSVLLRVIRSAVGVLPLRSPPVFILCCVIAMWIAIGFWLCHRYFLASRRSLIGPRIITTLSHICDRGWYLCCRGGDDSLSACCMPLPCCLA